MARSARKQRQRVKFSTILALLCLTAFPLTAQKMAPWLTRSGDNARSGWDARETKLTQASVSTKGIIRFTTVVGRQNGVRANISAVQALNLI